MPSKPMNPHTLEEFLYRQIPLASALDATVLQANDQCAIVHAPLEPNRNHLGTAFGGSLGAVLILAGYTWVYQLMISRGYKVHVLLRKSEISYDRPVTTAFDAMALSPDKTEVEKFLAAFEKKGRARITIIAEIKNGDQNACRLEGIFVAQNEAKLPKPH